ncbi:MAG: iron-containing alcohol dehydrogenase, partial [Actinomycetota bacterium]|nr:iron-containing alcohol dehydrogenase [Actinomycetota bacterium]
MTAPFRDYYQFAHPTRVVAGRGMIDSVGFEFFKEGAKRPLIVTDQVIRGTGLIDKVEAGVTGGGLEPAAVFADVPQDSSPTAVEGCA